MPSPLLILIGTVIVNTFLLLGETARDEGTLRQAWRIAGATLLTVALASPFMFTVRYVLRRYAMHDLDVFANALIVAGVALSLTYAGRLRLPSLRRSLRSAPLLIVSNGIALMTALRDDAAEVTAPAFVMEAIALAGGFGLLLVAFIALCERISERDVPQSFRSAPIIFITAGLLALALMGFTGIL